MPPKKIKGKARSSATAVSLPLELQQLILDQFRHAFPIEDVETTKSSIQEVKGRLYDRDFVTAFGKQEYLETYACRWSASRSLAYTDVFQLPEFRPILQNAAVADTTEQSATRMVCIGGGAGAEIVAFAAACHDRHLDILVIDIADWSVVLRKLETAITTSPTLSKYASAELKTASKPLIDADSLHLRFMQQDILEFADGTLVEVMKGVSLCTIMFTLNELFTSSISKTTAFLLRLADALEVGACLLVVDSPGSYSEVKLGDKSKEYPMKWLLDHSLLEVASGKWERILSDDSRWFRLSTQLKYPIELENARYQIHLYRRKEHAL